MDKNSQDSNIFCQNLLGSICFHQKNVRFCTTLQLGQIISIYKEKNAKELTQKITDLRQSIKENLEKNIIPDGCKDCIYKINEYRKYDKICDIDLYYWYHCNCGCYYCSYRDETKGEFSDKIKEGNPLIYKTIKELYKLNQIDKEQLSVRFGGGELGVLKEFPKLVNLFLKNNVKKVWCESSGIRYSKAVEKILKKGKCIMTVAVCCGDRELYKKIKKRDKYKQVMNNLKRYVNSAKKYKDDNNVNNVISKFIILEGFNNNIEEVEKWLNESKKYGLSHVEISMEFCWGNQTKAGQKIEDYNYELFNYAEKRAKELNLILKKNKTSTTIMEQGTY